MHKPKDRFFDALYLHKLIAVLGHKSYAYHSNKRLDVEAESRSSSAALCRRVMSFWGWY